MVKISSICVAFLESMNFNNEPSLRMEGFQNKIFVVYVNMVNETLGQNFHPYSILAG